MYTLLPSPMESKRFNIDAYKVDNLGADEVRQLSREISDKHLEFCSVRITTDEIKTLQALEREGFFITDTLVYYKKRLTEKLEINDRELDFRMAATDDAEEVEKLSKETFKGYFGHYHADERLSISDCDQVYADWAKRSCVEKTVADDVILALDSKKIVAFATMKNHGDKGEGILFGVDPKYQGRGIYRSLIRGSMNWCLERGLYEVWYSTQINNYAVQKTWIREGCEIFKSYYTLHRWEK